MRKGLRLFFVLLLVGTTCAREPARVIQKDTAKVQPERAIRQPDAPSPQQGEVFRLSDGTSARFYGEADVRGKERFRIEMASAGPGIYYFSPTVLIGNPGQRLTLEIFNRDQEGHPFQVQGQGGGIGKVAPGKTETVTVTFPASSAVTFSCLHEGHAGELRVG